MKRGKQLKSALYLSLYAASATTIRNKTGVSLRRVKKARKNLEKLLKQVGGQYAD